MKLSLKRCTVVCFFIGALAADARASFQVAVTFNDSGSVYSAYYDQITAGVQAAAADWGSYIVSSGTLSLQVNFTDEPTGSGASRSTAYVGNDAGIDVWAQGALAKITSGDGGLSATFDALINIGASYLTNTLWFDPAPASRTEFIPASKIDAQSFFLHEFGHILFMNGWRDPTNGALPGNYQSTFDQLTIFDGTNFFFTGALAQDLYGGPVPLTYGNISHIGNDWPRPGDDVVLDLMNGVVFYTQNRYYISDLDLAIAADTGVVLAFAAVPEPSSLALLGVGLLIAGGWRASAGSTEPVDQGTPNQ